MTDRDNEERVNADISPPQVPTEQLLTKQPNPATEGLSFVSPTEFVPLPSQGRLYPEGHPVRGQKDLEIKHMTAKEEDILTSKSLIKKGIVLDRMLESILVDKRVKVAELTLGDKNALLVAARSSGFGPEYQTSVICPQCGEKNRSTFDLEKVLAKEVSLPEDAVETGTGTFLVKLPKTKAEVEIRPLFGKDEDALSTIQENKAKMKAPENLATTQLKMFIVSVDGKTNKREVDTFIENLPFSDARYLRTAFKQIMPDVDMKQTFACQKCDFEDEIEVPITVDFFWPRT